MAFTEILDDSDHDQQHRQHSKSTDLGERFDGLVLVDDLQIPPFSPQLQDGDVLCVKDILQDPKVCCTSAIQFVSNFHYIFFAEHGRLRYM